MRNPNVQLIRFALPALILSAGIATAQNDAQAPAIAGEPVLELYTGSEHFVGQVSDDLFIAVVVRQDGSLIGYLCDGEELGKWFTGVVSGERALVNAGEDTRIDLTVAEEAIDGTVALAGAEELEFSAEPAVTGAGLQRMETPFENGRTVVSGWVTLNDGRQRGILCPFPPGGVFPHCFSTL